MSRQTYDFGSATFFFFKAFGRRPASAVWIAVAQVILYTALTALLFAAFWPVIEVLIEAAGSGEEPDPARLLQAMGGAMLASLLGVILFLMILLAVQGAWLRLLTRDEVAPVFPMRFGGDELRLLVVNVLYIFFAVVLYIAAAVIWGLGVFAGAGIASAADGAAWGSIVNGLGAFILFCVTLFLAIYLSIRFAAAPALTVRQKRIRFFGAWSASRGITGWMFLSYLVIVLIAFVIWIIVSVLQQIVALGGMMTAIAPFMEMTDAQAADPDFVLSVIRDAISEPGVIAALLILLAVQYAAQIVYEGLWHGVGAYAAVRHDGGDDPAAVSALGAPQTPPASAASVGDAPAQG